MLTLKYRPRKFSDLVGQEHVVIVTKRLLEKRYRGEVELPAGFAFTGSRGTGKTTSARVLSATLNCEVPFSERLDFEPCGVCDNCLSVWDTNNPFVIELDAASNNGVDTIRTLRTIADLSHPGEVRVFILDEAHALSSKAWDAALKLFEEPPPRNLFVLCTTEPEALPETILSRLMRFSFKRIVPEMIDERLRYICYKENIRATDFEVIRAIANKAEGGMRDAIMTLEQLSYYKQPFSVQDFYEYFGLVGREVTYSLLKAARTGEIGTAKRIIVESFNRGVDINYFLDDMLRFVTFDFLGELVRPDETVAIFQAVTEVKAGLKYRTTEANITYLFALLLSAFNVSTGKPTIATEEDIASILG